MTFFLHIGCHKTGTTSIQNSLLATSKTELFKSQSIFYLNNKECAQHILFLSFHNNSKTPRKFSVNSKYPKEELRKISIEYLKKLEKQKKYQHYISSSEFLYLLEEEEIIDLKNNLEKIDMDIKVIFFIRNPIDHYLSSVSQNYKFLSFLDPKIEGYQNQIINSITIWRKIFDKKFFIYEYDKYINFNSNVVDYFSFILNKLINYNNNNMLLNNLNPIKLNLVPRNNNIKSNISNSAEMLLAIKRYRKKYNLIDEKRYPKLFKAFNQINRDNLIQGQNKIKLNQKFKSYFIKTNLKLYNLLFELNFKYLGNWRIEEKDLNLVKIDNSQSYEIEDILDTYNEEIVSKILVMLETYTNLT